MSRIPDGEINTFREVFDWITYDWDYDYSLGMDKDGNFYVNKLYIEKEYLTYKTECYKLKEGLFEKVQELYEVLNDK